MGSKPKIALYWCSSCGGCEESVIDLAGDLLTVVKQADILFWPVAIDTKYEDLEGIGDGEIEVTLINGAIRMDDQVHMARLLRKKSRILMAHGSCAHLGGVVGLANFFTRDAILQRIYHDVPSAEHVREPRFPGQGSQEAPLPYFSNYVQTLDQVVSVDYYIPGCPPTPELIKEAIFSVLEDRLPEPGKVLADDKALCHTCPLSESKPDTIRIQRFKRVYETEWDPTRCFLDQGIICLGPVTRGGCRARCIRANMPCRGCFGPLDNVLDQGAKASALLSAIIEADDVEELEKIADSIPDPGGLFYRYGLAASVLRGKVGGGTR
jgi:F420-non-reducing hydrogenase small subunit